MIKPVTLVFGDILPLLFMKTSPDGPPQKVVIFLGKISNDLRRFKTINVDLFLLLCKVEVMEVGSLESKSKE